MVTPRCSKLVKIACRWAGALGLCLLVGGQVGARPVIGGEDAGGAIAGAVDIGTAVPVQGGGISLQEAIRIALEQHPGRVARAVTIEEDGRRVHEIRIVLPAEEGGRVVTVRIEAGNGR